MLVGFDAYSGYITLDKSIGFHFSQELSIYCIVAA